MSWMEWYNSLAKPSWTPHPTTIGLTWQILYPVILVSFLFVFAQAARRKIPWLVVLPFAINLVANLISNRSTEVILVRLMGGSVSFASPTDFNWFESLSAHTMIHSAKPPSKK